MAKRSAIKGRRSEVAVRLLAKCFLLLMGTVIYHQCGETKQYQEKLRTACAAQGGKLTISDLCFNLARMRDTRSPTATRPRYRLEAAR